MGALISKQYQSNNIYETHIRLCIKTHTHKNDIFPESLPTSSVETRKPKKCFLENFRKYIVIMFKSSIFSKSVFNRFFTFIALWNQSYQKKLFRIKIVSCRKWLTTSKKFNLNKFLVTLPRLYLRMLCLGHIVFANASCLCSCTPNTYELKYKLRGYICTVLFSKVRLLIFLMGEACIPVCACRRQVFIVLDAN